MDAPRAQSAAARTRRRALKVGNLRAPKGLLLDFGGTLLTEQGFDPRAGTAHVLALARNPRGLRAEQVQELVQALTDDLHPRREAAMLELGPQLVHRLVYEPHGIVFDRPFEEIELEFFRTATQFTPEAGVNGVLEELSEAGVPMAVVSNSSFSGNALSWELARHDLLRFFAFLMSSGDYVVRKPHPVLFATAAAKLGFAASELWYVGDSLEYDVAGARAAGMTAIWYNRLRAGRDGPEPDREVHDWRELGDLVLRLGV